MLDHAPPEEARQSLADLIRINTYFGGHSVIRRTLAKVIRAGEPFKLLDVGAASGDTARLIKSLYPQATVVNLDHSFVNLAAAPSPSLVADAFHLPFGSGSFDYVFCSLFLHHFEDSKVRELLSGFYQVARKAVIVCDLERHVLPFLFLPASKPFFRWHWITVYDGKISVRAAFRAHELKQLAYEAEVKEECIRAWVYRPAFRIGLIATKTGTRDGKT